MKKWILAIILCLVLCLAVCAALADGSHPSNPYQTQVREIDRLADQFDRRYSKVSVANINITTVQAPELGTEGHWTVSVDWNNLPSGVSVKARKASIRSVDPSGEYTTEYLFHEPTDSLTSCTFAAPGTYQLVVFYDFSDGSSYAGRQQFTIAPSAEVPSLENKVAAILAECRVEGDDWQTALNIHDWLTHHAYYDYTYSFYGAQDVLYRGTGVCDSYSKAFWFLMDAAGIEHQRAESDTHAWNTIKLDGEWYHVDATWDDPGDAEVLVSGNESHDYFCINDGLIYGFLDQNEIHLTDRTIYGICNSLDMSYPIRGNTWQEGALYYENGKTRSYEDLILSAYETATGVFTVPGNQPYPAEGGGYYSSGYDFVKLMRFYYAYGLTLNGLTTAGGDRLAIDASYDMNDQFFTITATPVVPVDNELTATDGGEWHFTVAPGESVTMTVVATCKQGGLYYQWYTTNSTQLANGTAIEGATNSTLTVQVNAKQPFYYCIVSDDYGNTSAPVSFRIDIDNSITINAVGSTKITVSPGDTLNLAVEASCGMGSLNYQWQKGGASIAGATGTSLTTDPVDHNTTYSCSVTDEYGGYEFVVFTVTVDSEMSIRATAPQDQTVATNGTTRLSVEVEHVLGTVSYQWYSRTDTTALTRIEGATAAFLTTEPVTERVTYVCRVFDQYGNHEDVAFLLRPDNQLTVSPAGGSAGGDRMTELNSILNLSVTASCTKGSITYQWSVADSANQNVREIENATGSGITTDPITGPCRYICTVTDDYGNTAECSFRIRIDNQLTAEPAGETAFELAAGDPLNLGVIANCGQGSLHYQWRYNGSADPIEGAESATLTGTAKTGYYDCTVTDDYENSVTVTFHTTVENHLTASTVGDAYVLVLPNGSATLTAAGDADLGQIHYQWYYQPDNPPGRKMDGETAATLTTPTTYMGMQIPPTWGTCFYCLVTDDYGNSEQAAFTLRKKNTGVSNAVFTLKPGAGSGNDTTVSYTAGAAVAAGAEQAGDGEFYTDADGAIFLKVPQCPASFTAPLGQEFDHWTIWAGGKEKELMPGDSYCTDAGYTTYTLTAQWKDIVGYNPLQYVIVNGEVTITKYAGLGESVTVPAEIDGYPVTIIGAEAFRECATLKSITLPEGLTTIRSNAFLYCTALEEINIPTTVTTIGTNAFCSCQNLTAIVLPDNLTAISDALFNGCSKLASVNIPDGVTSIGFASFGNCAFTAIDIPDSVTTISDSAFYSCRNLTEVTVPEGVTTISYGVFSGCWALESIMFEGEITGIGERAFEYCRALTEFDVPDAVTSIGAYAFSYCTALTSVRLPSGVKSIGDYAFSECKVLRTITLPAALESMGTYAFNNCWAITRLSVPSGVTELKKGVFRNCLGLTDITIPDSVRAVDDQAFFDPAYGVSSQVITVHCDAGSYIAGWASDSSRSRNYRISYEADVLYSGIYKGYYYNPEQSSSPKRKLAWTLDTKGLLTISQADHEPQESEYWGEYKNQIRAVRFCNGVEKEAMGLDYALEDCVNLTSVIFPTSEWHIPNYCFKGCTSLEHITIPETIESIGAEAFEGSGLKEITIPESIEYTGTWILRDCEQLTSVYVAGGANLGNQPFYGCTNLDTVEFGSGTTAIAENVFRYTDRPKNLYLPASLTSLSENVFQYNTDLTFHCPYLSPADYYARRYANIHLHYTDDPEPDLVLPEGLTEIEEGAFTGIPADSLVRIPSGLQTISPSAFGTDVVLLCDAGSEAEQICEAKGFVVARIYEDDE